MTTTLEILADASLPYLNILEPYFKIIKYHSLDELSYLIKTQELLLCRSNTSINAALLKDSKIKCIATASSGIDHIDLDFLRSKNITLLDAKSCNAHAVADYVLASIAYCQQKNLLHGKKIGIIGLGAVGSLIYKRLQLLQFEVCYYDPFLSSNSINNLFDCDIICVHPNLHTNPPYPSANLINDHFLKKLKKGVVVINASRGKVVDEDSILKYKNIFYCTDVYINEPNINKHIVDFATLCTPHIAGHTIEAKKNAIIILKNKLLKLLGVDTNFTEVVSMERALLSLPDASIEKILQHYNPYIETKILKNSKALSKDFLQLRSLHSQRHDWLQT